MHTGLIVLIVLLIVLAAAVAVLYFLGRRAQKKQEEQQAQIEANKQTVTMLVIDKKKLRLKDSGLPQAVMDQTPKLLRRSKLPIVKAKVGPQILSLVADEKIFDSIPVRKEIKAQVSGIYIVSFKGARGSIRPQTNAKPKSRFRRWLDDLQTKAGAKPIK
ncbi:hypothetical protein [Lachnoclostridium sp. Marseille-P6806]|uniref:hypothetical protein n=1 Tax=Lachnoclostridium sp. Marseille-P6806 TaxID=2364793 RepID=UPI0010321AC8|nr:hypothetical protein [Lachnoclostridium sp. Marseille-P6806]